MKTEWCTGSSHIVMDSHTNHVFASNAGRSIRYARGVSLVMNYGTAAAGRAVSGRVLSSTALPLSPGWIVVDEVTNRVFVSSDGVATRMLVSALDATSGKLVHTITLDQGAGLAAVDERRGLVLATGDRGVSMLDAQSWAVVRTIPGGPGPVVMNGRFGEHLRHQPVARRRTAPRSVLPRLERRDGVAGACITVAVDERDRYLVVLNLNSSDLGPGPWAWIPVWLRRWLPFLPGVPVTQTLASSVTLIDLSHVEGARRAR